MKAVIYARVSTGRQKTENQIPVLEAWRESRGYEAGEVYQEKESAWTAGHQKELARLIDDAAKRTRKFDIVLVWALDRLSREGAGAILALIGKFDRLGVKVYSYQESWTEYPGEMRELLIAISGWVARLESTRRSERVKIGIARKRKENGGRWGRRPGTKDSKKRKKRGIK